MATSSGPFLPALYGRYVYGDYCIGDLHSFLPAIPHARDDRPLGLNVPSLSSFGEDNAGSHLRGITRMAPSTVWSSEATGMATAIAPSRPWSLQTGSASAKAGVKLKRIGRFESPVYVAAAPGVSGVFVVRRAVSFGWSGASTAGPSSTSPRW